MGTTLEQPVVDASAGAEGNRIDLDDACRHSTIPTVLPDIRVTPALSATTITEALLLGVVAVSLAPLFTLRRLRHTDIPAMRVVE